MRPLRLMSLNLRRDVETDGPDRWAHRRGAVASLVRRETPHILATQEGLAHQLEDLDGLLPDLARIATCRLGDGTDEHMAIHYDPRRVLLVATGDLWLSHTPGVAGSRSWGNRLPRLVAWARFTDQESGRSFTLANTHLDHESRESRLRSARFLAERLPGSILAGDFNEPPGGEVHRILTASRVDARDAAAPAAAEGTFHGFTGQACGRIDWILVPPGFEVSAFRVLRERVEGRFVSDHHPIVADLRPAGPARLPAPRAPTG